MKFTLLQHQDHAIGLLRHSLATGHKRPMLQAPTGAGKTIIGAAIVEGAVSKGNSVIFTVPFLSLVDQTVERFAEQGITCVGVIQGQHPATDPDQPVQVATIQTLMKRAIPPAGIVLIDEAHKWFEFYGEWMARPEWARVPFVGLSATPWTKGLGKHYDDLLVPTTTKELIGKGLLSPFKVFAPSHPDLSKVKTVNTEYGRDYQSSGLSKAMSEPVLVAGVVSTWLKLGEDRPTLCFAVDRAHARKLSDEFEAAGVPTGYVDMDTPADERQRIGERLKNGQIKVVCNVYTLTTGVDWDVRCIILARPTKSEILFTQIVGRGLRTAEGKDHCLILDHSDTTLRLGFVDDIHHEELDDGKHQKSSATKRDREPPKPKECPSCSHLKPAGVRKCPSCGFEPTRQSQIEEQQGELIPLKGKRKARGEVTPHTPQEVWSMLLWWQEFHGKSPKFAKANFFERYGGWPDGLHSRPMAPDASFGNWMKHKQIAYAKGQAKLRKMREAHAAA
ncbi:DEAD/DEAH box helicase [Aquamicrobium defluvii]|uniref:Helicase n=1 Tax=Aquamicrobium defluvii TaxID=69279 RepID=A0A011TAH4_9HYPH|nr:DEAD/DEAH box helicase [Aquamicrobium defluvii]EXL08624.1 helicase [Aquamicrobium defluvii]EZQ14864.1 helicase [Halopseudomonas bauzanensis]